MKCAICPNTIDETKPAEPADSVSARQALALEISKWQQVSISVGHAVVTSAHVCGAHSAAELQNLTISTGGKK